MVQKIKVRLLHDVWVNEPMDVLNAPVRSQFTFNEEVLPSGSELDKVTEEMDVHKQVASVIHIVRLVQVCLGSGAVAIHLIYVQVLRFVYEVLSC